MTRSFYSQEVKRRVIESYQIAETVVQLSTRLGPIPTTIYRWLQTSRTKGMYATRNEVGEVRRAEIAANAILRYQGKVHQTSSI